jgi:hypothetical protein
LMTLGMFAGCGGGGPAATQSTTPPPTVSSGTYKVTVTGTSDTGTKQTVVVALTVQ